jgi:hypothetical protein
VILVDDKTAIVDQEEFDNMLEYSCTLPTGTIVGKRWKRREPYHTRPIPQAPNDWYMGEYVDIGKDDKVGIVWRRLYVA